MQGIHVLIVNSGIRLIIMYLIISRYGRGCRWSTIVLNKLEKKWCTRPSMLQHSTVYTLHSQLVCT